MSGDSAGYSSHRLPLTTHNRLSRFKPPGPTVENEDTARPAPRSRRMLPVRPPTPPSVRLDLTAFALLAVGLLVAVCLFSADPIGPGVLGGPLTGSGGTLGAWLAHWLAEQLAPWPRGIAVGTAIAIGLALALDRLILAIVRGIGWVGHVIGRGLRTLAYGLT